jgi:hypothetical protein
VPVFCCCGAYDSLGCAPGAARWLFAFGADAAPGSFVVSLCVVVKRRAANYDDRL